MGMLADINLFGGENHYQIKNGSFLRGSIARAWRRRGVFVAMGFQFD